MERVRAGRERARAESVARWTAQIEPLIQAGELDKARQKLDQALREVPEADALLSLGRSLEELQKKQRRIRDLVAGMKNVRERRNWEQVQAQAAEALALGANHPWLRKSILAKLTECAREVLETDWRKSEEWLAMARSAEPSFAPPEELARSIGKKKRAAGVEAALGEAKQLQTAGKRREALAHLEAALREFSGEARLESARAALAGELERERARTATELREIGERAAKAASIAELDSLIARLAALSPEASQHTELASVKADSDRAVALRRRQLGRDRLWSAFGGRRGIAIAAGTAVLLAAITFGVVRLMRPAHPASISATSEAPSVPVTTPAPVAPAPAPVESGPEPPPAGTPAAPPQGVLEIVGALPQARVMIDGRPAGDTDGLGRLRLEVAGGRHSIEISKDGYKSARFESRFQPGGKPVRPSPSQIAMSKLPQPPVATPAPTPAPPPAPKPSETKTVEIRPVDTEPQDWNRVANSGNIQDLQDYLRKHPGGAHEKDAQAQIGRIQQGEAARADQAAWDNVDKANKAALQDFIGRHGNSSHAAEARGLLDGIQRREAADAAAAELKKKGEQENRSKADTQAVLRTLTDYEGAFNRMDLAAMERLYSPMPAALREQFRGFKSVSFSMKPTSAPVVNGDTATVTCTRSQSVLAKQGGRFATPTEQVRVTLSRTGQGWVIRDISRI
jgi:chemotaxis protein histidine kinase CheA